MAKCGRRRLNTWRGPAGQLIYSLEFYETDELGNQLDNIPLLCLFLVFFFARAGETWGLDARSKPSDRIRDAFAMIDREFDFYELLDCLFKGRARIDLIAQR